MLKMGNVQNVQSNNEKKIKNEMENFIRDVSKYLFVALHDGNDRNCCDVIPIKNEA